MTEFRTDRPKGGIGGNISAVISEMMNLMRGEVALARAEASEKMSQVVAALVMAVLGTALIMAALVILLQAIVLAVTSYGVHPGWSAAIVGGVTVVVGVIFLLVAKGKLQAKNLAPEKTLNQLRKDRESVQEVRS